MSRTLKDVFPPGYEERMVRAVQDAKKDGSSTDAAISWATTVELIGLIERDRAASAAAIDALTGLVADLERRVTELEKSK